MSRIGHVRPQTSYVLVFTAQARPRKHLIFSQKKRGKRLKWGVGGVCGGGAAVYASRNGRKATLLCPNRIYLYLYISGQRFSFQIFNLLGPSQIIRRLTFLTSNLTTRLIHFFLQNITSFIVACFINKSSSRIT
jgi:hypothetical protein